MTEEQFFISYPASLENIFGPLEDERTLVIMLDSTNWERISLQQAPGEIEVVWCHKEMEKGSLELRLTGKWPLNEEAQ